jgi:hypothetical protein
MEWNPRLSGYILKRMNKNETRQSHEGELKCNNSEIYLKYVSTLKTNNIYFISVPKKLKLFYKFMEETTSET